MARLLRPLAAALACAPLALAQHDPLAGQWGKDDPDHVRVMTWNVQDALCSTNAKDEPGNDWAALARVVAALRPDVLLLQEAGDNEGNGTGSGIDSVGTLATTLELFLHGGADPFLGGTVTEHVQRHAPGYDLPHVFVGADDDGFNRSAVLSRWPFVDLNGDGRATLSNVHSMIADEYVASGGVVTPRGTLWVELDLPDEAHALDLVVANSHLRAGSTAFDLSQRIAAGQKIAYFTDWFYNGAGTGVPDPHGKVLDSPQATSVVAETAAIVHAGDMNDAAYPAEDAVSWCTRAAVADGAGEPDGPDADRTDLAVDQAVEPFSGADGTWGGTKLDYVTWEDSRVTAANALVFESAAVPAGLLPAELSGFPAPALASAIASDHRPVVVDLSTAPPDCDGDGLADWSEPDTDGDGVIDDCDNCGLANPDQADADGDGVGDACESPFCHPTFGSGTMALSFCGDAFSTQGTVFLEPKGQPGWIVVGFDPLPVPAPLPSGPDLQLVAADALLPFTTAPGGLGTALPGPIALGDGPAFLVVEVQVVVLDAAAGVLVGSNGVALTLLL